MESNLLKNYELKELPLEEQKALFSQNAPSALYYVVVAGYPELFAWYIDATDATDIITTLLKTFIGVVNDYLKGAGYPIDIPSLERNFEKICERTSTSTWSSVSWDADFRMVVTALSHKYSKCHALRGISERWITTHFTNGWLDGISGKRCDKLPRYILENANLNTACRCNLAQVCFTNGMRRLFDACLDKMIQQDNTRIEFIRLVETIIRYKSKCKSTNKSTSKATSKATRKKYRIYSVAGMVTSLCRKIEKHQPTLMTYLFDGSTHLVTFASSFPFTKGIIKKMVKQHYPLHLIGKDCLLKAAQYSTLDVFFYLLKTLHLTYPDVLVQEKHCLVYLNDGLSMETNLNVFSAALCCNRSPSIAKYLVRHIDDWFVDAKDAWLNEYSR